MKLSERWRKVLPNQERIKVEAEWWKEVNQGARMIAHDPGFERLAAISQELAEKRERLKEMEK